MWDHDGTTLAIYCYPMKVLYYFIHLTVHYWQKWRSIFLPCPCHKINSVKVVGLFMGNYTLKIKIFVNIRNLRQFRENLILVNNPWFKFDSKNLMRIYHTIVVIICRTLHFVSTLLIFLVKYRFPFTILYAFCKIA